MKLSNLEPELTAALERMMSRTRAVLPVVIVDDTVTNQFVQFAGSYGRPIFVDVPNPTEGPRSQNVKNFAVAHALFGEPKPVCPECGLLAYNRTVSSVQEAVQLGLQALRGALCLPEFAELKVTEICQREDRAS